MFAADIYMYMYMYMYIYIYIYIYIYTYIHIWYLIKLESLINSIGTHQSKFMAKLGI